jgi:hypothetical protein
MRKTGVKMKPLVCQVWKLMPVFHDCQRCTACCLAGAGAFDRWRAAFLQAEHDFIQRYTRLQHDRRGLALQEQADGACVLLEETFARFKP